jgi:hypothetical protein
LKKIIFLFTGLFISQWSAFSQPCGPNVRVFDQQMITPSGDILLLNTWLGGELMMVGEPKGITLNYALISSKGELKKDTSIYLYWPDYYYDFMSCNASYASWNEMDQTYSKGTTIPEGNCPTYMLFSSRENVVIGYFLKGDRKYAYDLVIDPNGISSWKVHDLDSLQKTREGYTDDISKMVFWEQKIQKMYDSMLVVNLPSYTQYVSGNYDFKAFNLECVGPSEMVYSKDSDKQDRWQVKGKRWQIPLEGYLIHMHNQPLVSMNKKRLYITVFNDDKVSCPGYGRDVYPILYCIDLKKGRIVWEYSFMN